MDRKKRSNVLIILVLVLIILLALILFFAFSKSITGHAIVLSSEVNRSFDRAFVYSNQSLIVTLTTNVQTSHINKTFSLVERVPPGWNVTSAGTGVYTSDIGEIRWLINDGVDTTTTSAYFTYTLRAPLSGGVSTFSGDFYFAGQPSTTLIYGQSGMTVTACTVGTETCNNLDDDCDYTIDEGCDDDNDNYCDSGMGYTSSTTCPLGGGDCDDNPVTCGAACNPGILNELTCDDYNNDCDALTDEGCDTDNDNWCNASMTTVGPPYPTACPLGGGDCNESNINIYPGASEFCNNLDDNCNSQIDENWPLKGTPCGTGGCSGSYVCNLTSGTSLMCDGGTPSIEICDNNDNDCDTSTDEGCDTDNDNWCNASMTTSGPPYPTTCALGGGDCNESSSSINPGATEVCDGINNNCINGVDENPDALCTYPGNTEPDQYTCFMSGCDCQATYEEDDSDFSWTVGDCSGCVDQNEMNTYGDNWLNGETEITMMESANCVDRWKNGVGSCL